MTNSNKRRGDWAERVVQAVFRRYGFPWTEKTRAGYERDLGDLHLVPARAVIVQVKNVRAPRWLEWLADLEEQKTNAGADVALLVWKPGGLGETRADEWLSVMRTRDMAELLRRAGYGHPLVDEGEATAS